MIAAFAGPVLAFAGLSMAECILAILLVLGIGALALLPVFLIAGLMVTGRVRRSVA